jgi:uncharacterized protein YdeI (YjbR/CyaY-like superfamily)
MVSVTITADKEPRTVDVPPDFAAALEDAGLRAAFDALSHTRRRELVEAITGAKKPDTRARRTAKALVELGP